MNEYKSVKNNRKRKNKVKPNFVSSKHKSKKIVSILNTENDVVTILKADIENDESLITTIPKEEIIVNIPVTRDYTILYEDESCLVIDKPAGVMVHPDHMERVETVSDWMGDKYPESIKIDIERPGIVHRLDRDTSGCLLLIKNKQIFQVYKNEFQEHKVKKVYIAIVSGIVKNDTGIIDTPIARAKSDFRKREVKNEFTKDYRGVERDAITRYKVIERIMPKSIESGKGGGFSVLECFPVTGRTHQIRVHLRSIRHPIIGDTLYGSKESAQLAGRQMLHAKELAFTTVFQHKIDGEKKKKIVVEAPIPIDIKETLERLREM